MRTSSKRVLAICLTMILLAPGLSVLAEETTETGDVSGVEILQTVSGSDMDTEVENGHNQIMPLADGDIASGTDGNITWVIDADGKLTVNGTGDLSGDMIWGNSAWGPYREQILSADINVSGMTDASYLFYKCKNMESLNVTNFNTHSILSMTGMFQECSALMNLDLSNFDTSNVRDMSDMFIGCSSLINLDVSGFNTEDVTDMHNMFRNCSNLTRLDVSNFNTGKVTNMEWMFADCSNLISLDIGGFDTGNVHFMEGMFYNCSNLESLDVSGFKTENVWFTGAMFESCSSLTSVDVSGFDTGNVTDMRKMFSGCSSLASVDISSFETSNVRDMSGMFSYCSGLTNVDVSGFDTSNVTEMGGMFSGCSSLTNLDVSGFDTSNVVDMGGMFLGCSSLTNLDLSSFETGKVTCMDGMFSDCIKLTSLDLSNFNTSSVTSMRLMFSCCAALVSIDVSKFDTGNVIDMAGMFQNCRNLNALDLSNFNTCSTMDMGGMFYYCSKMLELDVHTFFTSNVIDMGGMFYRCGSLTRLDLSNFDVSNVTDIEYVIAHCYNMTELHTPCNVTANILMPTVMGTTWHLPDGTEVTELPRGLDHSVTLTRSGTPTTPQITITTPDLNMADVVRVKYVPYSYTVETNNIDPSNAVTFSIEEGRLADGLELYPATGEIYGVPLETGSFPITVKATYSNPAYLPSYAELTLTVLDNTDANVGVATDAGYDITQPIVGFDTENTAGSGTQTLVSQGEYTQFRDVYIDGVKLTAGRDYTSESGSTRITILNQTLSSGGEGTHTLGIEFRTVEGTLKRAAQNYVIGKSGGNGNTGDNSGANTGDQGNDNIGDDNGTNSNAASLTDVDPTATLQYDFIIYTVEKGDSLWKIAAKFYGQGSSWRRIYEDNKLVIKNPSRLYKGQQLIIRLTATTAAYVPEAAGSTPDSDVLEETAYRIQPGDRLWTIARRAYGSGKLWTIIYEANRDVIADPEHIRSGQTIRIPKREMAENR